jgi:hypothetical protein
MSQKREKREHLLPLLGENLPWVGEKVFLQRITLSPKMRCLAVNVRFSGARKVLLNEFFFAFFLTPHFDSKITATPQSQNIIIIFLSTLLQRIFSIPSTLTRVIPFHSLHEIECLKDDLSDSSWQLQQKLDSTAYNKHNMLSPFSNDGISFES